MIHYLFFLQIEEILLKNPEALYNTHSRSGSIRDTKDRRKKGITTNGLLTRTVL
jgi:hypothetical protein